MRTVSGPVFLSIRPPGSKSVTIRALAAAALATGRSHLYGPLAAEDTEAMVRALEAFAVAVSNGADPWAIDGTGGHLRSPESPIDAGESGLTARLAMVLAALAEGTSVITGRERLLRRPIQPLVRALRDQGVDVATTDGMLPVTVSGRGGLWGGSVGVDCTHSSQFASALLLAAPLMTEPCTLRLEGLSGSSGYLDVTAAVMEAFGARVTATITGFEVANDGYRPADYLIEPDASAAVYPMVAAAITGGRVEVEGLTLDSKQPDITIAHRLSDMGCHVFEEDGSVVVDARRVELRPVTTDSSGAPDGALALAVACVFADGESRIDGLASLRHKESDRLEAMATELSRVGADARIEGDSLVVSPGEPAGATIDPHGDHRIAMAMALVGLRLPGVAVAHPEVVNKTWPGYWEMLESVVSPR